jgi:hypothetical protein
MLDKVRIFFGSLLLITCLATSSTFAMETDVAQDGVYGYEKVYVTPEQVIISNNGIFYLTHTGELVSANILAVDSCGLYVLATRYCRECHSPLKANGGCSNTACKYNR